MLQRLGAYVVALILVPLVAYPLGTAYSVAVDCHGDGTAAECDIPGIAGIAFAIFSVPLVLVAIILIEVTLAIRRQARSRRDPVTRPGTTWVEEPENTESK